MTKTTTGVVGRVALGVMMLTGIRNRRNRGDMRTDGLALTVLAATTFAQNVRRSAMTSRLVGLALMLGILTPTAAMAADDVFLKARHSDKCAQVDGGSADNGANISQWDCLDQNNVKWTWVETGNGYVFLKAKHSGKCAQVDGASQANGANISQWDCLNQDNVKWQFKLVQTVNGQRYYNVVNKASGKCMQVNENSNANGANISQWDCVNQDNVKWALHVPPTASVRQGNLEATAGFDLNGFSLFVEPSNSLSDLIFTWKSLSHEYDAFNVRVRISDGREGQVEVGGGSEGRYRERNAAVGRAYTFMVQGCDKGTFGSTCTAWSQFSFTNTRSSRSR